MYDGWFASSLLDRYYEHSGFLNVGYWRDGATTQLQACNALVHRLLRAVPGRPHRVLDVGCGTGATTQEIQQTVGADLTIGINFSASQLVRARHREAGGTVRFACMDAASMGLADAAFDLVVCVEAAFHFDTRLQFFREAHRILAPGGMLVASDMLFGSHDGLANLLVPPRNRIADPTVYADSLRAAGFVRPVLEDARDDCWLGYRDHLERWLDRMVATGGLDDVQAETMRANARALDVAAYLLVHAVKPEAAA